MDWILADVARTHGLSGMEPVLHPKAFGAGQPFPDPQGMGGVDGCLTSPLTQPPDVTAPTTVMPPPPPGVDVLPPPTPVPGEETLPLPRPVPGGPAQGPALPGPEAARLRPTPVQQAKAVEPAADKPAPKRWEDVRFLDAIDAQSDKPLPPPPAPAAPSSGAGQDTVAPPEPKKEPERWRLFPRL